MKQSNGNLLQSLGGSLRRSYHYPVLEQSNLPRHDMGVPLSEVVKAWLPGANQGLWRGLEKDMVANGDFKRILEDVFAGEEYKNPSSRKELISIMQHFLADMQGNEGMRKFLFGTLRAASQAYGGESKPLSFNDLRIMTIDYKLMRDQAPLQDLIEMGTRMFRWVFLQQMSDPARFSAHLIGATERGASLPISTSYMLCPDHLRLDDRELDNVIVSLKEAERNQESLADFFTAWPPMIAYAKRVYGDNVALDNKTMKELLNKGHDGLQKNKSVFGKMIDFFKK